MLASRGVDPSLNDDIVQEVAVRALDKQVPFTDPNDLYRWAATAARRLHIDHLRSDCRMTGDDSLLSVADGTDVAHLAERRVALGVVWRALAAMRPGERDAILDSLEDREARTSGALVRRHRARATLRKAVGGAIAWAAAVQMRLRDLAQPVNAVAAAAVLAPVLATGAGGTAVHRPAAPERVAASAPVASSPSVLPRTGRRADAGAPAPATTARSAARPPAAGGAASSGGEESTQVEVGPIEYDQPEPSDAQDPPVFCLENHRKPVWCVPDLRSPDPREPDPRM